MSNDYLKLLASRPKVTQLGQQTNLLESDLVTAIESAIDNTPAPTETPTVRAAILFGGAHEQLWEFASDARASDAFNQSDSERVLTTIRDQYANGLGTVLFFTDTAVTKQLRHKHPHQSDWFKTATIIENGMAQMNVWTLLTSLGLGASLQHFNPEINDQVLETFNLETSWLLQAQMPFGSVEGETNLDHPDDATKQFKVLG
ncbi:nitroreductase family protein [Levilactobacillus bambusae]|uniref:Nitroreductase domain-containing protein n=1 Tax=Levilactobacillus bambusae TaxID=2024736 RepID=A0A2V1N0I1_9LACO|nr:nitroreductase family protein [Levilactobacillus bambusae]PWG00248.1 hypothetical protein DCM90_04755 [Levilactobacillus bambusae]